METTTKTRIRTTALTVLLAGGLAGCAATNPCEGKHGGLCAPSREIWGVTRNRDQINPTSDTIKEQEQAAKLIQEKPGKKDLLPPISTQNIMSVGAAKTAAQGQAGPMTANAAGDHGGPEPLLTQPRIEKVWIAPWSRNGTLHFPGYVYTIVTPEQWVFAPAKGETPVPAPEQ
ncbi:type IV conjugative transfer system lipoprotein TraV [Acidithiobacillus sp. MC6.1]|nr:type IV conjugative transfer system lipoprotein TraV [Acidithiobacillus sp. MC6.1]